MSLFKFNLGHPDLGEPSHYHRTSPFQERSRPHAHGSGNYPDSMPVLTIIKTSKFSRIGECHSFRNIVEAKTDSQFSIDSRIDNDIASRPRSSFSQEGNQVAEICLIKFHLANFFCLCIPRLRTEKGNRHQDHADPQPPDYIDVHLLCLPDFLSTATGVLAKAAKYTYFPRRS